MQEKCYNIGSGEGVLQMQILQKQTRNTGARTDTRRYREGRDTNGMTTIFDGFRLQQHWEKESIYSSVFSRILSVFPLVFPCTGTREKIYRKILEQKSWYWDSFFLMQLEKDKGSQKRQCNSNSSPSTTKATAIRSVSTEWRAEITPSSELIEVIPFWMSFKDARLNLRVFF